MDKQALGAEAAEDLGRRDQPEGPRRHGLDQRLLAGGPTRASRRHRAAPLAGAVSSGRPRRIAHDEQCGGHHPEQRQTAQGAERPAPAHPADQHLTERHDEEDAHADPGAGDAEGQSPAVGEPPRHQDDGSHPPRGRDPDRGEESERQVELPGVVDHADEGQGHAQHHRTEQDEAPPSDAIGEPAEGRAQTPMHEGKHRECPGEHRPAPAELAQERHQEDAVGIPDPVGDSEGGDDGRQGPAAGMVRAHCVKIRRCAASRQLWKTRVRRSRAGLRASGPDLRARAPTPPGPDHSPRAAAGLAARST